jgi:hypothetical protein
MLVAQAVISTAQSRIVLYNLFIIVSYQWINIVALPAFGEYRQEAMNLIPYRFCLRSLRSFFMRKK